MYLSLFITWPTLQTLKGTDDYQPQNVQVAHSVANHLSGAADPIRAHCQIGSGAARQATANHRAEQQSAVSELAISEVFKNCRLIPHWWSVPTHMFQI